MVKQGAWLGLFSYMLSAFVVVSLTGFAKGSISHEDDPIVISLGSPVGVDELRLHFDQYNYTWPPEGGTVPPLVSRSLPKDLLEQVSAKERKSLFLRTMLPIVLLESRQITEQRERVEQLFSRAVNITRNQHTEWLYALARQYRVVGDLNSEKNRQRLLKRLDVLPPALVLAQAAIESGWGTSRFALQGNSLFGQWSYSKSAGLVPENRIEGASHVVKQFDSLSESVRSYMRNINSHDAYRKLRQLREVMREDGLELDPFTLAEGLVLYSQRREEYVSEVQEIIRVNKLDQYDEVELGA